jgi:hypothetical protein
LGLVEASGGSTILAAGVCLAYLVLKSFEFWQSLPESERNPHLSKKSADLLACDAFSFVSFTMFLAHNCDLQNGNSAVNFAPVKHCKTKIHKLTMVVKSKAFSLDTIHLP